MKSRYPAILFVVLFVIIIAGCASFPGKDLQKITYSQIAPREEKPSIDYNAKFLTFETENAATVKIFQEEIDKVFKESNVFSRFSVGIGKEKYHLSLVMKNEGSRGLAFLSGFISGLTFTIIPGYARDNYILTVDVKEGEQLLKRYEYKHHMNSWIQLFLIVLTPTHNPAKVVREVWEQMLLKFLYDLEKDRILKTS